MPEKIGVYPGTFDPITNGHIDIIRRATVLFDKVVVAVTTNPAKRPLFTVEERVDLVRTCVRSIPGVVVDSFDGLLVEYARRIGATAVIRGLRAVSDFEFEFQMALVNRKLNPDLVIVFLMPNEKYTYLNSTIVKEVAQFGGNISCFVPEVVERKLKERFGKP
ncbi:MAG TPA: pantetheine-phosphate adenylyltransferase [Bacteroidetes bacterium]|nr:pantetheine-phosphate adenylyltransferase [Bacteroidota bacterium]